MLADVATPASTGVAVGVAETLDDVGRPATTTDEVPHLPHLPHPIDSDSGRLPELLTDLTERAAILEFDAGLERAQADVAAVRIVQCATCQHWKADPLGGDGIGTCATGADSGSWSAFDRRPISAWPGAPRLCGGWEAAHG
jgi:hypothetical protein